MTQLGSETEETRLLPHLAHRLGVRSPSGALLAPSTLHAAECLQGIANGSRARYPGTMQRDREGRARAQIERVQTGVRLEARMLKVLKGLAELKGISLGDLIEGIVLHAFDGKAPFSRETLKQIERLREVYGLTLHASDSHRLEERPR